MTPIEFDISLPCFDSEGASIEPVLATVTGRVYQRTPTEADPSNWQLHDYVVKTADGQDISSTIDGPKGDLIAAKAEEVATATLTP